MLVALYTTRIKKDLALIYKVVHKVICHTNTYVQDYCSGSSVFMVHFSIHQVDST